MGRKKIKIFWPTSKCPDIKFNTNVYEELLGVKHKHLSISPAVPILIGLTPRNFKITFQDENIQAIDFDEKIDLVAISSITGVVDRAYEIADEFRKRNVPVIMGGIHVSSLPEEALQHADSVVIGEVEGLWKQILKDFQQNKLKKIYKSEGFYDFSKYKVIDYRKIDLSNYWMRTMQTSRGCPYSCEFCTVSVFFGNKIRCKPVKSAIKELQNMYSQNPSYFCGLMLMDDHFNGPRKHAIEFLKELEKIKFRIDKLRLVDGRYAPWYYLKWPLMELGMKSKTPLIPVSYLIQARMDIYKDDEMLDLLAKTGCNSIIIGFESISQASLNNLNKKNNAAEYKEAIAKIQSKGLGVQGSFIFGNDLEDISVFRETAKFIKETKMASPLINIVTPYPGTRLYNRLKEEGRLLNKEYCYYDSNHVCFTPKSMTVEELQDGYYWLNQKVYEPNVIRERLESLFSIWTKNNILHEDARGFITSRNLECNWFAYSMPIIPDEKYL